MMKNQKMQHSLAKPSPTNPGSARRRLTAWGWRTMALASVLGVVLSLFLAATSYAKPKNVSNKRMRLAAESGALFGSVDTPQYTGTLSVAGMPGAYTCDHAYTLYGVDMGTVMGLPGDTPEEAVVNALVASAGFSLASISEHKLDPFLTRGWINVVFSPPPAE